MSPVTCHPSPTPTAAATETPHAKLLALALALLALLIPHCGKQAGLPRQTFLS